MRYLIRATVVTMNGKGYWRYFNGKWSTNKSNGFPIAGFSKSNDEIKFYPTIDSAKEDAEKMQWVDGVFKVEIVEETTLVKKRTCHVDDKFPKKATGNPTAKLEC